MTSETLSNIRPEVFLEIIDRESVRNLVSGDSAYLKQAMAEGKNIHQVTLDRQDQVNNFMMKLCEADLGNLCITSFSAFPTQLNQQVTSANLSEIGVMQRLLRAIH